jgi:hypothetical protein
VKFESIVNKYFSFFTFISCNTCRVAIWDTTNFDIYDCVQEAAELLKDGIDLITDADAALSNLLSYPLHATLSRSITTLLD